MTFLSLPFPFVLHLENKWMYQFVGNLINCNIFLQIIFLGHLFFEIITKITKKCDLRHAVPGWGLLVCYTWGSSPTTKKITQTTLFFALIYQFGLFVDWGIKLLLANRFFLYSRSFYLKRKSHNFLHLVESELYVWLAGTIV